MTTDRTAAAIRRHLLDMADERPAEGQLETTLQLTATIRQRSLWAIALRGVARPWSALPPMAIRLALIATLLGVALAGLAAFGGGSAGGSPFHGIWTSIDTADGSHQTLVVGSGANPTVQFEDAMSMVCRDMGDASTLFLAEGPGTIDALRLTVRFGDSGCITWRIPPWEGTFDYDPAADTLVDHEGITWHRGQ